MYYVYSQPAPCIHQVTDHTVSTAAFSCFSQTYLCRKKHADPEETGLDLETKHIFLAGKVGADDAVTENST